MNDIMDQIHASGNLMSISFIHMIRIRFLFEKNM